MYILYYTIYTLYYVYVREAETARLLHSKDSRHRQKEGQDSSPIYMYRDKGSEL